MYIYTDRSVPFVVVGSESSCHDYPRCAPDIRNTDDEKDLCDAIRRSLDCYSEVIQGCRSDASEDQNALKMADKQMKDFEKTWKERCGSGSAARVVHLSAMAMLFSFLIVWFL